MVDSIGAGVAALLFLVGIIAWNMFIGAIPFPVPAGLNAIAVLGLATVGLLVYNQLDPSR